MRLDFRNMDIATFEFRFLRVLMTMQTGGAEINECLQAVKESKRDNDASWVAQWANAAERVGKTAEDAAHSGRIITARQAYLRASSYYRAAMFSLPPTDMHLFQYLTLSREYFHKAAKLFSPQVEILNIPLGDGLLPGYFLSAGPSKHPTLIALNGGDSTNEELVHWFGFAAVERGWNYLVFEGPGQWSALQLNPGLTLRVDYEVPVKAAINYLLTRDDVDAERIALYGCSLSSLLGARAVAFEKRICACVLAGGPVIDVNEAWEAVWPPFLQKAVPGVFNFLFTQWARINPRLAGFANHYKWVFDVKTPRELIEAWRPFNIKGIAPKIDCPLLLINGEADYAQTDARTALTTLRFINELACPVAIHEFSYEDGWAASHCQIGALSAAQAVIFDWLDRTVNSPGRIENAVPKHTWTMLNRYHNTNALNREIAKSIRIDAV